MTPDSAAGELWRFSLAVYSAPGVAAHCLELQDRHGADVNLVLAVAWAGASGRGSLTVADIARMDRAIAPLRAEVVEMLRHARRWLKSVAAESATGLGRLRVDIKAAELAAERQVQSMLAAQIRDVPKASGEVPGARLSVALGNVETYLRHLGADGMASRLSPAIEAWISAS